MGLVNWRAFEVMAMFRGPYDLRFNDFNNVYKTRFCINKEKSCEY